MGIIFVVQRRQGSRRRGGGGAGRGGRRPEPSPEAPEEGRRSGRHVGGEGAADGGRRWKRGQRTLKSYDDRVVLRTGGVGGREEAVEGVDDGVRGGDGPSAAAAAVEARALASGSAPALKETRSAVASPSRKISDAMGSRSVEARLTRLAALVTTGGDAWDDGSPLADRSRAEALRGVGAISTELMRSLGQVFLSLVEERATSRFSNAAFCRDPRERCNFPTASSITKRDLQEL